MKKTLKIVTLIISFIGILSLHSVVNAATATIKSSSSTVTVGKSVTITVNATAAAWNLKVSGETNDSIVGMNMDGANQAVKKTYTITPKKAGKYTVYLKGDITDGKTDKTSKINTYVTITAKEASNTDKKDDNKDNGTTTTTKKSNNANLSSLGVKPVKYDFKGFAKDKTSYSVTIPNDVDKLDVVYRTADSKAKVKITGNTNLEVGTNNIKVVVTAEDGKTTKTYTIKVTKLAVEDEKPGNLLDENKEDLLLKSLSVKGLELSPEFASDVYSYQATINMDENDMSEVKVIAEANMDKAIVEVTGNTNLVEGENLINVIVKASNSSEQIVYQITVNKVSEKSEVVSSNSVLDKVKDIKKEYLIIGGFLIIVVIIIVILIINYIRSKKDYDEDEELNNEEIENAEGPENNNLIEELFNKKKNGEKLNKSEEKTIEDIEKENDRIFNKPKPGVAVEYDISDENKEDEEEKIENKEDTFIADLKERRKRGKHF